MHNSLRQRRARFPRLPGSPGLLLQKCVAITPNCGFAARIHRIVRGRSSAYSKAPSSANTSTSRWTKKSRTASLYDSGLLKSNSSTCGPHFLRSTPAYDKRGGKLSASTKEGPHPISTKSPSRSGKPLSAATSLKSLTAYFFRVCNHGLSNAFSSPKAADL